MLYLMQVAKNFFCFSNNSSKLWALSPSKAKSVKCAASRISEQAEEITSSGSVLAGNTINNNDTSTSTTTITTTATTSQQQHQRLMFKIEGVAFDDVNQFCVCEAGAGVSFSNDEKTIITYVLQNKNVKTTGGSYNYKNIGSQFNLFVRYNKCW